MMMRFTKLSQFNILNAKVKFFNKMLFLIILFLIWASWKIVQFDDLRL